MVTLDLRFPAMLVMAAVLTFSFDALVVWLILFTEERKEADASETSDLRRHFLKMFLRGVVVTFVLLAGMVIYSVII